MTDALKPTDTGVLPVVDVQNDFCPRSSCARDSIAKSATYWAFFENVEIEYACRAIDVAGSVAATRKKFAAHGIACIAAADLD